jgi:modulator of FtsH protease HflC
MNRQLISMAAGALILAIVLSSVFTVSEGEWAVGSRFGAVRTYEPGLHWCWPFERLARVERRSVSEKLSGETFLSSEQQGLSVDLALIWKVHNPAIFLSAAGGDEQAAGARLADVVRSDLKSAYAQLPLAQIIALADGGFGPELLARLQGVAQQLGIRVLDAHVQRIDTTEEVTNSIFKRMQAGFEAQAQQIRAEGAADAGRIRAEAERNRVEILAAGTRDAQRVRGEADGQAASIYARAYGRSPEFANFYRTLQAYRAALGREGDILVIEPEGDFYKYLRSAARH